MSSSHDPDDAARERYWNEDYVRYWRARVEEANQPDGNTSHLIAHDLKSSPDRLYAAAIELLKIRDSDSVLELACGFGRSLPLLSRAARKVTAVDISREMISAARESVSSKNVEFHVSPSEHLPFAPETFDVVVCFAAFDAMYQTEALIEINRVCKSGARILITGKNDNYEDDDTAALDAECGARRKGHPNFFTDVRTLVRNIDRFGFSVSEQQYYRRRGDFVTSTSETAMPSRFYEFLFVLEKRAEREAGEPLTIGCDVSKTYVRLQRAD